MGDEIMVRLNSERDAKIRNWFVTLLASWQRAWDDADPGVRAGVEASLCHLEPPIQGALYLSRTSNPPLEASVLILTRNENRSHADLAVRARQDASDWVGDAPECHWAQETVASFHDNMQANWTQDRTIPLLTYRSLQYQRLNSDGFNAAWTIPGDLTTIDVAKFMEEAFRPRLEAVPAPRQPDPRSPIAALRATREPTGLSRWLTIWAPALSAALGVQGPSWCGLFLPRADVLDSALDGDIDFITGPLELEIDPDEWERRVGLEADQVPIWASRQFATSRAMMQAAADGLIQWPPRLEHIGGCEVKVSWFDATNTTWHATHAGESRRVKGQLKVLRRFGFSRVGFFHLGATKPRSLDSFNPWLLAGSDASLAWRSFELLFPPSEMPDYGYFQAVVGGVPFAAEDLSGAGGSLRVHQPAALIGGSPLPWREQVARRLSKIPRPRLCRVFIRACSQCGAWSLVDSPSPVACASCGGQLYDDSAVLAGQET